MRRSLISTLTTLLTADSKGLGSLLNPGVDNPFPWLAEMMDLKKEQNFFEGTVTDYQKSSSLGIEEVSDEAMLGLTGYTAIKCTKFKNILLEDTKGQKKTR